MRCMWSIALLALCKRVNVYICLGLKKRKYEGKKCLPLRPGHATTHNRQKNTLACRCKYIRCCCSEHLKFFHFKMAILKSYWRLNGNLVWRNMKISTVYHNEAKLHECLRKVTSAIVTKAVVWPQVKQVDPITQQPPAV